MMPVMHVITLCVVAANWVTAVEQTKITSSAPSFLLSYIPPLGQVAEYSLSIRVDGYQTSLDERGAVKWSCEATTTEEVIARARDGAIWLRARGAIEKARDATGVFSGALPMELPAVQFRLTPRGEVLEVSPATGESIVDARGRALLSMLPQVTPPILPGHPVRVGDMWTYEAQDEVQTNQLVSIEDGFARVRVSSQSRLVSREAVPELGLATDLEGEVTQDSLLHLRLSTGLVERHVGEIRMQTTSTATLDLAEGPQIFDIQADLGIRFDLVLTRLNGKPTTSS
jgi:hypothetical protein